MRSSRPYVQLDPAVIEQARQMDLLSYLRAYEPNNLVRVGGSVYCTREHDSLKISNGKRQRLLHQRTRQLKDFQWQAAAFTAPENTTA